MWLLNENKERRPFKILTYFLSSIPYSFILYHAARPYLNYFWVAAVRGLKLLRLP